MEKKLHRMENIQLHEFVAILLRNPKIYKKKIYVFTIRQKRIRGGSMYAECNSGAL